MRKAALAAVILLIAAVSPGLMRADDAQASSGLRIEESPLPGGGLRELEYRGGALIQERLLDRSGALIEESFYGPIEASTGARSPEPYEKRAYLRSGTGRLLRVESRDAAGALIGGLDYRYDREGRLLGVSASGSLGEESAGMLSSGGAPSGAWTSGSGTTTAVSYDDRGRPIALKALREGKAIALERRAYGEGSLPLRVESEDLVSGLLTIVDYDEEGRSKAKAVSEAGRAIYRSEYSYDEEGRLAEEATRFAQGGIAARRLSYDPDGSLSREETRRDGVIIGAVDYVEGGRIEELYRDGELFVKATYRAGRKVKDEFFAGGERIREKEYE